MENKSEVMVAVMCYNHEAYIEQCLDSVFMQQCNFTYKVCVYDDCSTDKSMDIIESYKEKYGDKLLVIQPETNQYQLGILNGGMREFLKVNNAKYMAFCEGDDCWTDDTKLQRQYDAMEQNENATLCVCDVKLEDVESGENVGIVPGRGSSDWSGEEMLNRVLTYDLSIRSNGFMVRTSIFEHTDICSDYWNYWAWDNALSVYCLLHGDYIYIERCMGMKRVNNEGSVSRKSNIESSSKWQIGVFESDLHWIQEFRKIAEGKYEDLIKYYIAYRQIRMYYLKRNELKENKLVSNVNGKMYTNELRRKLNRLYIRLMRKMYHDNECKFVKQKAEWMEKEWNRLQSLSQKQGHH